MSRYPCDTKVYVGDLGNNARKNEIEDSFSYYGPLRSVWIARNPPGRPSFTSYCCCIPPNNVYRRLIIHVVSCPAGFAFVEFESARDAEDAVRGLDGRTICGRRARVEVSNGKGGRGFRGPSSRSRGKQCNFNLNKKNHNNKLCLP